MEEEEEEETRGSHLIVYHLSLKSEIHYPFLKHENEIGFHLLPRIITSVT